MERLRPVKCAVFFATLFLCFLPSLVDAQSIGGACSTAGSLSLIGSSSPGELLVCNGSTWGLAEAITSGGLVGIGTTAPGALLEVHDGSVGYGGITVHSGIGVGNGRPWLHLETEQNSGYWHFEVAGNNDNSLGITTNIANTYAHIDPRLSVNDSNGAPSSQFYVNGNVSIGASYRANAAPANGLLVQGNVGIGSTTPVASLDLSQKTDALALPVGTTGQRPTGANGMVRYNSTTPAVEAYVNGAWASLGGGGSSTITLGTSASATNPQRSGDATTGLFSPAAGAVSVASGGTEYFRINSSGNVGIGSTLPTTELDVLGASQSGSGAVGTLNLAQTWNTTGAPTFIKGNVTNTASNAASKLLDLQIGGTTKASIRADSLVTLNNGNATGPAYLMSAGGPNFASVAALVGWDVAQASSVPAESMYMNGTFVSASVWGNGSTGYDTDARLGNPGLDLQSSGHVVWYSGTINGNTPDVYLLRDATETLGQRDGTNAQQYNIYNTYTDATHYERAEVNWIANFNVFTIQTTKGSGGGTLRNIALEPSGGNVGIGTTSPADSLDIGSRTDAITLPVGTTGQRPTPANGMLRYNSTTPAVEAYVNGAWASLGGGGSSTITLGTSASATNPQRSGDATTGLFSPAAGAVSVASGGTEYFRINTSGNVGIGTTAPSELLHVRKDQDAATNIKIENENGGASAYAELLFKTDGTGLAGIWKNSSIQTGYGNANSLNMGTIDGVPFSLVTNNSSRLTIDPAGNVGIGTTAPAAPLHVAGEVIVGNTSLACSSTTNGGIRWNNTDHTIEMCDGTNWNRIAAAPPAGCTGPSAFSFTDLTSQSLSTVVTSNTITPSGCATALSVSVSGAGSPQISINGGAWVSSAGMNPGDTIAVRQTTSGSVSTARAAVVSIGTTSSTWTVTTLAGQTQLFQTANRYNGNLGGLSGADAVCMSEANAFGYAGTWKAILSTSTTNARDRLTIQYPVVLASTGATIAATNLWNTLTGSIGGIGEVWTGSNGDGTSQTYYVYFCSDWTSSSSYGSLGYDGSGSESYWLAYYYQACTVAEPFYCVNQ